MSSEGESSELKSIHIDLEGPSITFTGMDGRAIRFNPALLLNQLLQREIPSTTDPTPEPKEQLVTLPGRLKTQPKEGRGDSKGNPTAWALFAAHQEGAADAHMYLATFHGGARNVVMTLPKESQITVSGYPHPAPEAGKNDTLSVMRIDYYPGKQSKGNGS